MTEDKILVCSRKQKLIV